MEDSIKVFVPTLKRPTSLVIPTSSIDFKHLKVQSHLTVALFSASRPVLYDCVFHEVDISLTGKLSSELVIADHVLPFIARRIDCKDTFCQVMTCVKLGVLHLNTCILDNAVTSPVNLSCYAAEDKWAILDLLKAKRWNYRTFTELHLDYKIYYVLKHLTVYSKLLQDVNVNVMSYGQRVYFFLFVSEHYRKAGMPRLSLFYQMRCFLALDENLDEYLRSYVLKGVQIEGNGWRRRFSGKSTDLVNFRMSQCERISLVSSDIYVPRDFMADDVIVYIDKVQIFSDAEILYLKTKCGAEVPVYGKYSGYLYLDRSMEIVQAVYRSGNCLKSCDVQYNLIRIDRARELEYHSKRDCAGIGKKVYWKFLCRDLEWRVVENDGNFIFEYEDGVLFIYKVFRSKEEGQISFCYRVSVEYEIYKVLKYKVY